MTDHARLFAAFLFADGNDEKPLSLVSVGTFDAVLIDCEAVRDARIYMVGGEAFTVTTLYSTDRMYTVGYVISFNMQPTSFEMWCHTQHAVIKFDLAVSTYTRCMDMEKLYLFLKQVSWFTPFRNRIVTKARKEVSHEG